MGSKGYSDLSDLVSGKEEHDALVNTLLSDFTLYEGAHSEYESKWSRYFNMYRLYIEKQYSFSDYRIASLAFSTVMSVLPRLVVERPRIQYLMKRVPANIIKPEDMLKYIRSVVGVAYDEGVAEEEGLEYDPDYGKVLMEQMREQSVSLMNLISDTQWRQISGDRKLAEALLVGLIYGTYILHVFWNDEYNSPDFTPISPFEFYPDPTCNHPDNLRRAFRRTYLHYEDVQELYDTKAYNIPLPEGVDIRSLCTDNQARNQQFSGGSGPQYSASMTNVGGSTVNEVEIIEWYHNGEIVTIVGRMYIARYVKQALGRVPFLIGYNYQSPGEFWGMGEVELIEQQVEEITDLKAVRKENLELTANNMYYMDLTVPVIDSTMYVAPHNVIRGYGPNPLTPLPRVPISVDSYRAEDIINQDVSRAIGLADYFQGVTPNRMETATAVNQFTDSANARWSLKLRYLADFILIPIGKMWLDMNKKYLAPVSFKMDIKDRNGNKLVLQLNRTLLDYIRTDYDIETIPGDSRATEKQQIVQLFQILSQSQLAMQYVKPGKLIERLFDIFDIAVFDVVKSEIDVLNEQKQRQAQEERMARLNSGMLVENTSDQQAIARNTITELVNSGKLSMRGLEDFVRSNGLIQ